MQRNPHNPVVGSQAPALERILRRPEVERATELKRSSLYAGMAAGTFPVAVPLGEKAVGWLESEVAAWQEHRIKERAARTVKSA
jgi:prophage regulatory protein